MKNKHVKSFNELNENKKLNISDVSESKKNNSQQVQLYANELLNKMYDNKKAIYVTEEILKFCDVKQKDFILKVQEKLIEWTK